ncbi:MAG: acyl-CoA dehydrogenase family protein [Tepidiformaceae bacterium]
MSHPPVESSQREALLEAVRALGPMVTAAAEEIESGRRLPLRIVEAMKQAGVFRMPMPREWGGPENDPLTQIEVIEELSYQNGSVGWCAMIGSDGGYFSARMDQDVSREMYADLDAITGGAVAPLGRAVAVAGGYRVTGRWPFGSGCQHSTWMSSGCFVYDGETPRVEESGRPTYVACFLPGEACEILDTWHTTGLRGSGSHDYAVDGLFVPEERTFSHFTTASRRESPLYRFPMMFLCNQAAVPLGLARAALDEVLRIVESKKNTLSGGSMREDPLVQAALSREDARIGAARNHLMAVMGDFWATLCNGNDPTLAQRARFRSSIVYAHEQSVEAVGNLYGMAGSAALYSGSVLDRCLRDIRTLNQHIVASPAVYAATGKMLLGMNPPPGY